MAQTPVKPFVFDTDGMTTQLDSLTQYLDSKGYCFEASCSVRVEKSGTQAGYVDDGDPFVAFDDIALQANSARFTILLSHNGTPSNNEFIGYTELIPGDDSPVIVGVDATFTGFSFSNNRTGADYTIRFRKNSTVATPFYTTSKTNTQFFSEDLVSPESFTQGDQIYIQYGDDGRNARDLGIILYFKAEI